MRALVEDVRAFHEALEIPVEAAPTMSTDERRILRSRLILEESGELLSAIADGDLVEVADGIADLIYVAVGAALEFGIPLELVWSEVHRSNMAKVGGARRADGKVLKPDGWQPPDIAGALGIEREG